MAVTSTIVLHIIMLLILHISAENNISRPGCQRSCGGMPIPYPFGIGLNCSLSDGFNIYCGKSNDGMEIPYLMPEMENYNYTILDISIPYAQARLDLPVTYSCYDTKAKQKKGPIWETECPQNPFWINTTRNKFTVTGCHSMAYLHLEKRHHRSRPVVGCLSTCNSQENLNKYGPSCSGVGCCQTEIPMSTNHFFIEWDDANFTTNSMPYNLTRCSYAMVTDVTSSFDTSYITTDELIKKRMPAVFDWIVGTKSCPDAKADRSSYACKSENSDCLNSTNGGYFCNCSTGYEGNPYLLGGCQDIDECAAHNPCPKPSKCHNLPGRHECSCPFGRRKTGNNNNTQISCEVDLTLVIACCIGFVVLSFLGFATYFLMERRDLSKLKQKYFQQHGGWILLEKIKSSQGFGFTIFTKKQLEQATNNFDDANIIGHGGHGTVYKGILRGQTVAIKKCKIVNEGKTKEFGKEMLILSQISHKNIVKLLGCCLEVEVPMLVYEFMPNGTLFHYIHHKRRGSQISFTTRLRIAHESAEALAYLHTSASPPIFHGDVKTTNILLAQNYTSKISDFGASVLVPTDDAQFVTFVQGTLGYLDPEYMQTSQLTDKSDVYSFGVVLVELLTGKLVFNYEAPEEERNLSSCFLSSMNENKLQEIVDVKIKHEEDMELIKEVAELAKECLNIKGEERPAMKQVAEELHRIRKLKQFAWGEENSPEETWILLSEGSSCYNTESDYTSNYFSVDKEAVESIAVGR